MPLKLCKKANTIPVRCPRLHWKTDNPSRMHRCPFQHLCMMILNCALVLAIYIFVGLIMMQYIIYMHLYKVIKTFIQHIQYIYIYTYIQNFSWVLPLKLLWKTSFQPNLCICDWCMKDECVSWERCEQGGMRKLEHIKEIMKSWPGSFLLTLYYFNPSMNE